MYTTKFVCMFTWVWWLCSFFTSSLYLCLFYAFAFDNYFVMWMRITYNAYGSESIWLCLLWKRKIKIETNHNSKNHRTLEKFIFRRKKCICIAIQVKEEDNKRTKWKRKLYTQTPWAVFLIITATIDPTKANRRWLIKHKSWLEISLFDL